MHPYCLFFSSILSKHLNIKQPKHRNNLFLLKTTINYAKSVIKAIPTFFKAEPVFPKLDQSHRFYQLVTS